MDDKRVRLPGRALVAHGLFGQLDLAVEMRGK
jgi:hypothetical protein